MYCECDSLTSTARHGQHLLTSRLHETWLIMKLRTLNGNFTLKVRFSVVLTRGSGWTSFWERDA